ncbi:MAG: polysaccharide deacetylase family protein [Rhizobiales bacterium]|nr:polysaccharide deacetylase family protein [Hyphomicrobiales bacterium]
MPQGRPEAEQAYWLSATELQALFASLGALEARHNVDIQLDFDDANESDYFTALPLLKRFSRCGAFFVPTDRIDQPGFLTSRHIRQLAQEGMILGSHGTDHVPWTELSNNELSRQLRHSKQILENLTGKRVKGAAAPHGLWSPRVVGQVLAAGYERLHTCGERPCGPYGTLNHRLVVRRGDDMSAVIAKKLQILRRVVHKAKDLHDRFFVTAA